ncbi:hypothetical protein [Capnocytophaga sp. oral taxon 878]|uniref:hypothetical protein n=1 Tax=Capnocytophaga sp. oral taxon 878 TaxID=1316596 RepID=UPI000D03F608|nr:hypothetical protein [Capnocytophaga sp. oral taxon 878]AVM49698.1 hypothetical protein C4H12_04010 [Capnocytophaga sp. oral taxon 878]
MKQIFTSLLLLLLLYSCKNKVEEKQKTTIKEPITTTIPNKNPIPYKDFLKLNYEDFVSYYEDKLQEDSGYCPKNEITFIMNDAYDGFINEFRVELYNCFTEKETKERDILIKEVTWDIDHLDKKLTIWYHREQKHWVPIQHLLYSKDTNF